MRAGKLRHLVELHKPATATDDIGDSRPVFTKVGRAYAEIKPATGDEKLIAAQTRGAVSHTIQLRYHAGVTARWRVVWRGRVFELGSAINEDERNRTAIYEAVERTT